MIVGAFGLASRYIFYDWEYLALSTAGAPRAATVPLVFTTLLWPTFWMGVSLPVLARAVTLNVDGAARRVGLLYGLNTLGAAAAAFVSTWIVMPNIGLDGAILAAMRLLFERTKTVAEPSGACAFAAVLAGKVDGARKRVGVTITGGNVTAARFAELVG